MWEKRSKDIDGMMCVTMVRQRWEAHNVAWITKNVTERDLNDVCKLHKDKKKRQKKKYARFKCYHK